MQTDILTQKGRLLPPVFELVLDVLFLESPISIPLPQVTLQTIGLNFGEKLPWIFKQSLPEIFDKLADYALTIQVTAKDMLPITKVLGFHYDLYNSSLQIIS